MQKPQVSAADLTEQPTPGGSTVHAGDAVRHPVDIGAHQLAVALTWVRRGHPVIPCSRTDKGPMVGGFGRNATPEQLAPFSDPAQVEAWWTGRFKRAHVGLLTRRLVVVDLDAQRPDAAPLGGRWDGCVHGMDVLEILMREAGGTWPVTYTVETPSAGKPVRGQHLYFLQPGGEPIGCATGDGPGAPHLGPLIDVRGVGGLVIAAGSYSAAQGRPYTRVSPPEILPQSLPGWLLGLLRRPAPPRPATPPPPRPVTVLRTGADRMERAAESAMARAAEKLAALRVGDDRRDHAFAYARWLGEISHTAPRVLTEQAVQEVLLPAALACGVAEAQARKCIRNGWAVGVASPKSSLKTLGGAA